MVCVCVCFFGHTWRGLSFRLLIPKPLALRPSPLAPLTAAHETMFLSLLQSLVERQDVGALHGLTQRLKLLAIVITLLPFRFVGVANTLAGTRGTAPDRCCRCSTTNQGPGSHIRANAYRYNEEIEREMVHINLIRLIQERFLGSGRG